eukprot:ANDGO_07374.mRNA.1 ABC transporter D family member 2
MGILSKLSVPSLVPVSASKALQYARANPKTALLGLAALAGTAAVSCALKSALGPSSKRQTARSKPAVSTAGAEKKKVAVDLQFLSRLLRILKIAIPSFASRESATLLALTVLLFLRTMLSIRVADVIGMNAKHLVERRKGDFIKGVLRVGFWAVPASVVNAGLHMAEDLLALLFRKRLTNHVHRVYLDSARGHSFYHAAGTVSHADARIAQDIQHFATSLANLYANVFKPVLDVVLFTHKLSSVVGLTGPMAMVAYYVASGALLRMVMPNFAKLTAQRQALESEFRSAHSHLIQYSEEVAFYGGASRERAILDGLFSRLVVFSQKVYSLQFGMEVINSFLVKYGATMVGYGVCALPVFFIPSLTKKSSHKTATDLTQDYVRNSQLLINLARAIGALVLLYKKITALAGYTSRVAELQEQLDISQLEAAALSTKHPASGKTDTTSSTSTFGQVVEEVDGESIEFAGVDICAPDGNLLCKNMSFRVTRGTNVVVVGPNGCGKSSMFRVLGGLWPVRPATGVLRKPSASTNSVFYVPQKPYFAMGTLRDQIIYPLSVNDLKNKDGANDEDLLKLLDDVQLGYVVQREGGLDACKDWYAVLSGGEKQRMAMARLYFHKPKFAILDECTSAVSDDMRHALYRLCRDKGITVFSVAHQRELYVHHQRLLRFDGKGNYEWIVLDEPTLKRLLETPN